MRTVGLILVVLGALVLGNQGLGLATRDAEDRPAATAGPGPDPSPPIPLPPLVAGIAVTSGLILIAAAGGGRRGAA